jgi:tetratricopeptide (TPR) repeat protein
VIYLGRSQRYLLLGWFWFVGTLIPVIGIVQVGLQAYADRYTYIPYIGLFIMLAWGLPQLLSKWTSTNSVESPQRKIALGLSMVIVLTTLGICAHRQTSYWKNSFTLFSHTIEVTQNNWLAHSNLGAAYAKLGRWQETIEACKKAIRIKPNAVSLNNLGLAYSNLSRRTEAIEAFKQAIRIKPNYAEAHYNLGVTYGMLGRYQDAVEAYDKAVKIKPDLADAHYNLGYVYLAIGDKNSAMAEYNILKSLNSELADKLLNQINK